MADADAEEAKGQESGEEDGQALGETDAVEPHITSLLGEGGDGDAAPAAEESNVKTRFSLTGFENEATENLVSLESLMRFVFPEGLQHPLSTGRLYAFGFYGPLDRNAQLRSGHKGQHVVSRWELDTMCAQFEREDVLQVYILPGRPLAALGERQQDELIAQADQRIKAQTGKGLMPQLTRAEVADLFDDVARSGGGCMRFHEMQRQIMGFREERIKRLKVMYPKVNKSHAKKKGGDVSARLAASRKTTRRSRISPDVAPPEMFLKNKGMNNNSISAHTNRLLSTRAYKICDIEGGNSAELSSNVRLIRENRPHKEVGDPWDTVSKRPLQEKERLKMLCTLRDHKRHLEPGHPGSLAATRSR